MKTKESQLGQVSLRFIRSIAVNRAQTKHSARNRMLANSHAGMATRLPPTWKLARPLNTRAFVGTNPTGELITPGLPVTRELFSDLMPCTLLTHRRRSFAGRGDHCRLWPPS